MLNNIFAETTRRPDVDDTVSIEGILLAAEKDNSDIVMCEHGIAQLTTTLLQLEELSIVSQKNEAYVPAVESIMLMVMDNPSLEGNLAGKIKDWATSLWESIVKSFKTMWAKIKDWYLKIFSAAVRIKKRAEAMREAASKSTGSPSEKNIEMGSKFKSLVVNKGDTKIEIELVKEAVSATVGSGLNSVLIAAKNVADIAKELTPKDGKIENGTTTVNAVIEEWDARAKKEGTGEAVTKENGIKPLTSEELEATTLGPLPGNKSFYVINYKTKPTVTDLKSGAKAMSLMGKVKVDFAVFDVNTKVDEGSLKTLTPSEIESMADAIIAITSDIVDFEKSFRKVDGAKKDITSELTSLSKAVDNEDALDSDSKTLVRAFTGMARGILSSLEQPRQKVIAWSIGVCINSLDFCQKSIDTLE